MAKVACQPLFSSLDGSSLEVSRPTWRVARLEEPAVLGAAGGSS